MLFTNKKKLSYEFVYNLRKRCYNGGMEKRIIAFDIGDKRIGVAVSDPFNSYAMPGTTYFRTGKLREDVAALIALAQREDVGTIVCGLPVFSDGKASLQTQKTVKFIETLKGESPIPVVTEDERYTTAEALRDLGEIGVSARQDKRKKAVDSIAAAYILENYLINRKRGEKEMKMKEESNDYEEEYSLLKFMDEDGEVHEFNHKLTFEYKGEWYLAVSPLESEKDAEEDEEAEEIAIYHIVGEEENEEVEVIEDEALLDEVFAEFCRLYEDFEDAEEAAALEPDKK